MGDEHRADLELVAAAARGDPAALRRLDALIAPVIATAAARLDRSPAFADEVGQALRVRLLVPDGDAPPRLLAYSGKGPLRAWVAVAALRVALNLRRGGPRLADSDVLLDLVDREPDPELRHLKTTYRNEYRVALEAALAALTERQRALLRLHYVEGLRLLQIGRLFGVSESSASRWLAAAVDAVAAETRRRLIDTLKFSDETIDSVARMVLSGLDLSIARILRD